MLSFGGFLCHDVAREWNYIYKSMQTYVLGSGPLHLLESKASVREEGVVKVFFVGSDLFVSEVVFNKGTISSGLYINFERFACIQIINTWNETKRGWPSIVLIISDQIAISLQCESQVICVDPKLLIRINCSQVMSKFNYPSKKSNI